MAQQESHALWNRTQAFARRQMPRQAFSICSVVLVSILVHFTCHAQIDPYRRQLLQFGYNQPVKGHWPMAGYLFYLLNQPDFLRPDLTLRLAVAPTYLDGEFGFNHALGPHTDLALGLSRPWRYRWSPVRQAPRPESGQASALQGEAQQYVGRIELSASGQTEG
jgi:hypothetical protein